MLLKLEEMTTEQKLGMLFCSRGIREKDTEFTIELLKKKAVGCVSLPFWDKKQTQALLEAAEYPVLTFTDTEEGFPETDLPLIPLMSLSACNNHEYYKSFAKGVVRDSQKAGFNGTWGPVIDILLCDGPSRVGRSFSTDPAKVAEGAAVIAQIFKDNGFLSTGKHYPGSTDSPYDSHMAEAGLSMSKQQIIDFCLAPYKELMDKGLLPCIMTGHRSCPNIDPDHPASLSKKCIDIIRDMGFDGLCFTDSLAMMAILQKYGEENAYGLAIAAGNDIILPNYRTTVKESYEMLVRQYEKGVITDERINESARRVLRAMEFVASKPANPTVFTEQDEKNLHNVARDCITAVCDDGLSAKLDGKPEDKLFIVTTKGMSCDAISHEVGNGLGTWYEPDLIVKKIREEFPGAAIELLPEFPSHRDNERVLAAAANYNEVVIVSYCDSIAYLGTDCLTRRNEAVFNGLIRFGKVSAIVHFGNPYALQTLEHSKRKIFGYKVTESQGYAIEALSGKIEAKGVLPYAVDFK